MEEYHACQMDFLEACSAGDMHKIVMLLGSGRIDTNFKHRINGWTGLHWASRRGHLEVVKLLLKFGFDANSKAKDGRSSTDVATEPKVKEVLSQHSLPPPDESSSETMVQLSHDAPVKESSNENNNGLAKGDMQPTEEEDNLGELPPRKKSRANSFDLTASPPPASPTTPTRKQELYSYGRRDSVDRTRFLLVRTSHARGKETFRRITLPGGGSVEMMKSTIERTLRAGKVAQVFTLPDRELIETKQQIRNFGDSQKIDVVFEDIKQNLGNRRKGSLKETGISESARINKHLAETGKAVSMSDENMMSTQEDKEVERVELQSSQEVSPKTSESVVEVCEEESSMSTEQLTEPESKDSILSSYEVLPPSKQVDDMEKDEGSRVELDTAQESEDRIELKHDDEAEEGNAAPIGSLLHNGSSGVLLSVDTSIDNAEDLGDISISSEDIVDLQTDAVSFHNNEEHEREMEKEEKEEEKEKVEGNEKQEEKEENQVEKEKEKEKEEKQVETEKEMEKDEEKEEKQIEKEKEVVSEDKEVEVQDVAQDQKDSGDVVLNKDLLEDEAKHQDIEEIPEVKELEEITKVEEIEAIREEVKEIPKEVVLQAGDDVPEVVCEKKEAEKETEKEIVKETERKAEKEMEKEIVNETERETEKKIVKETEREEEKETEKEIEHEIKKETEKETEKYSAHAQPMILSDEVKDMTKNLEDLVKQVHDLNITSESTEQEGSTDKSEGLVSGSETEREEIPEAICIRHKSKAQEWLSALVGDESDPQRQMKIALLAAGLVGVSTGIAYYIFIKIH